MSYQVENCTGKPEEVKEIALFLASFVADGEGASNDLDGRKPETWEARLDWWWKFNPYCGENSPRGLLLRREDGVIAGFFGFIPHHYILDGEIVPSLISTTTFVRRDSREAALGMFLRAHRLREDYQLVDGGPNEEARALLERTGYQKTGRAKMYFYPVKRRSIHPRSLLLQGAGLVTPRANGGLQKGRIVTRLKEVGAVAPIVDSRLRKHVDRETLVWYLASGSSPKSFVGWCDEHGVLQCYLIGTVKRRMGLTMLVLMDAESFDPALDGKLSELIAQVSRIPEQTNLPDNVDLMAWPAQNPPSERRSPLCVSYDANLFYRLPSSCEGADRLSFPFEGDKSLL